MSSSGVSNVLEAVGVKRGFLHLVPIGKVFFPPKGHRLWHPRDGLPVKESLRDSIVNDGFRDDRPIKLWQQVAVGGEVTLDGTVLKPGQALLVILYGSRRSKAAYAAQELLRASGRIGPDDDLRVPVRYYQGDEASFHLERQSEDSDPEKTPHAPSVVAYNFIAAHKAGKTEADLVKVLPRDYEVGIVPYLLRWADVPAECAALFDAGYYVEDGRDCKVSINVLAPLLDLVPFEQRYAKLLELVLNNKHRRITAARYLNKQLRRAAVDAETDEVTSTSPEVDETEAPDIEDDGLDLTHNDAEAAAASEKAASPPARSNKKREPRVKPPTEAVKAGFVRRVAEAAASKPRASFEERAFFFGAQAALGEADAEAVLKELKQLGDSASVRLITHLVAGMLYRRGTFGARVQKLVRPEVLSTIEDTRKSKKPATSAK